MSKKIIVPSNYKPGYIHVTQGWPHYHKGKDAIIGKPHSGIDISCGAGKVGMKDARMYAIEDGEVIKIRKGNKFRTGYVQIKGDTSGHTYIYKHAGKYKRNTGGFFVEVGDKVSAGDEIATPDYSLTKSPHLHLMILDEFGEQLNPAERLLQICPFAKFSFSTSLYVREYYQKTNPDLLRRMENNARE